MNELKSYLILEEAKSKSQRRLFGMALAYKRGELDDGEVSDEIKELSKLPEDKLRDYAKTKEDDLPEKIEERNIQVKRKYGVYDSISVGKFAPVRSKILNFIQEVDGTRAKSEIVEYIKSTNEENGTKISNSWLYKNKKYLIEFVKNGEKHYKLSKLGKRVLNKTNISE